MKTGLAPFRAHGLALVVSLHSRSMKRLYAFRRSPRVHSPVFDPLSPTCMGGTHAQLVRSPGTWFTDYFVPSFHKSGPSPSVLILECTALLGRIRARYLTARLPNPPVRPVRETFASYGSRARDIMRNVHFASSTEHSPCTALRVRWVPLYCVPPRSLRAFAMCAGFPALGLLCPI